ncbi:hypothetical protein BST61_g10625 [Cercospora zeina]
MATHRKFTIGLDFGTIGTAVSYVVSDTMPDMISSRSSPDNIFVIHQWPGDQHSIAQKVPSRISYAKVDTRDLYVQRSLETHDRECLWGFEVSKGLEYCALFKLLLDKDRYSEDFVVRLTKAGLLSLAPHLHAQEIAHDFLAGVRRHLDARLSEAVGSSSVKQLPVDLRVTVPDAWSSEARAAFIGTVEQTGPESDEVFLHSNLVQLIGSRKATSSSSAIAALPRLIASAIPGSISIDLAFCELMQRRFGIDWEWAFAPGKARQARVLREWEQIKRKFGLESMKSNEEIYCNLRNTKSSEFYDEEDDAIILTHNDIRAMFDPLVRQVLGLVEDQVKKIESLGYRSNRIYLAGGMTDSEYLYKRCKDWASNFSLRVLAPAHWGLVAVRGAALSGMMGLSSRARHASCSYGVLTSMPFRQNVDPECHAFFDSWTQQKMCKDRITWLIRKGERLTPSDVRLHAVTFSYIQKGNKDMPTFRLPMVSSILSDVPDGLWNPHIEQFATISVAWTNIDIAKLKNSTKSKQRGLVSFQLKFEIHPRSGAIKVTAVQKDKAIGHTELEYRSSHRSEFQMRGTSSRAPVTAEASATRSRSGFEEEDAGELADEEASNPALEDTLSLADTATPSVISQESMFSQATTLDGTVVSDELIQAIVTEIFCTDELNVLFALAYQDPIIGHERLRRNLRRMIALYGKNLMRETEDKTETGAARASPIKSHVYSRCKTEAQEHGNDQEAKTEQTITWLKNADRAVDNPDDDEDEDSGLDDISEEDSDLVEKSFQNLKTFFLESHAYIELRSQLLAFAPAPYERRVQKALGPNVIGTEGYRLNTVAIRAVAAELSWIPSEKLCFRDEGDEMSWLDHVKGFVEEHLTEKWRWWPLSPRKYIVPLGYLRLTWQSPSGIEQYVDVPTKVKDAIVAAMETAPCPHRRVNNVSDSKGRSGASFHQHHTHDTSRSVQSDKADQQFFSDLKSEYLKARGWFRNWFSIWQYDHCQFYEFSKHALGTGEPAIISFPADSDSEYEFLPKPMSAIMRPPLGPIAEGEFRDFFYGKIKDINMNSRSWRLFRRQQLLGTIPNTGAVSLLPKKLRELHMSDGSRQPLWGLYAVERRSFIRVVAYFVLCNSPGLTFFFLWLFRWGHAGDLQNGTVPVQLSLSLTVGFVALIYGTREDKRPGGVR